MRCREQTEGFLNNAMTAIARKPDSLNNRYASVLEIAAPRQQWLSVKKAMETALAKSSKDDRRHWVLTPFLGKLAAALKSFKAPRLGEPGHGIGMCESNIAVSGTVHGWITVAEWLLIWGDEEAKAVGAVIVPACSNVVFSRGSSPQEGDDSHGMENDR